MKEDLWLYAINHIALPVLVTILMFVVVGYKRSHIDGLVSRKCTLAVGQVDKVIVVGVT